MSNFNHANLNYGIKSEIEVIQRKFHEYQASHDLDSLRTLYQGLTYISRNLPPSDQEIDQYRSFDR